jgi:hypothetical protein
MFPSPSLAAALLDPLPRSAAKLWAERHNPVWWCPQTWLGEWTTDDRWTWQTTDGHWVAQLQRVRRGRQVLLRFWQDEVYAGYQDETGWHPVTPRAQPRPLRRTRTSFERQLPLAG